MRDHERPGNWFYSICGYRLGDWHEYNIQKKLHFSDRVRLRAGKCITKYFLSLYKLTDQVPMESGPSDSDYPTDTDNNTSSSETTAYASSSTDSSCSSNNTSSSETTTDATSTTDSSRSSNTASSGTTASEDSSVIFLKTVIRNTDPERTNFSQVEYGVDDDNYRYVGPLQ